MVQSSVKYKALSSDVQDENESDYAEEEDGEEITIHFQSSFIDRQRGKRTRDNCIRVMVALILLGIVFGFMVNEWNGYWSGVEGHQNLSHHQVLDRSNKTFEVKDHDHHNHHGEHEDDDDEEEVKTNKNSEEKQHEHHHHAEHDDEDDDDEDKTNKDSEEKEHNHHHHGEEDYDDNGHNHTDGDDHHNHSHSHLYHNAAIITDSDICSNIGKDILQEKGNVVDAGIAALLCLGVVHPHTAGLGGVFSAILYNHTTGSFKAIRDTSHKLPTYGAPSLLQGLRLLHSNYGLLEWRKLFEGATKVAKDGFHIDGILSRALETLKEKILQSRLCDVFCNTTGHVKSEGAHIANENLSELLLSVSLNSSHFLETLAVKLAQDISEAERPAFLAAVQAGSGEISEPLITEKEKYAILSAPSQLTGRMVSNILDRVREQNLSFQSDGGFNNAIASYNTLLNLAHEFFNTSLSEILTLNTTSSHIGALDSHGNFIVISTSLNSTWGSGQYLPSSGVFLNDFTSNITQLPFFSFPLVVKIKGEDDADDHDINGEAQDDEMQFVAVTGGLSALLQSVVMLRKLVDFGMSAPETVNSPLLHIKPGGPKLLSGCMCVVTNGSTVYSMLSEGDGQVQKVDGCSDHFLSMLLQLKAEHIGVYGVPTTEVHADGY
ncbi:glutathione hydrolase 5 proenzyme-like isoform X1 [Myxocyprinus asiaticus]|uniref:glutathione hydrolase 5 proenzyme-like isoform X1 n=2 Tax=Myxocyprinus asiaticus TaxID=70543 RepID=UPI0022233321|nr:glutathione hydrolase 5 proenzyme-like isoform X1 [Myxocyprinus asiaticus]